MTDLDRNKEIVRGAFSAYRKGDADILGGFLDKDVDWQSPVTATTVSEISWSRPRHGIDDVKAFFSLIGGKLKIDDMSYTNITAQDDQVVIEGSTRGTVIRTGCFFRNDWVMICTVRNGKITRLRQYYDSADIVAAFLTGGEACMAKKAA